MLNSERQNAILDLLSKNKSVLVTDLVQMFDVSVATIRRDLTELENNNLLKRVYGGAVLAGENPWTPFGTRTDLHAREKAMIGQLAAELLNDDENVVIDTGTTVQEVVKNIKKKSLTVFTNSLPALNELSDANSSLTIVSLGGTFRKKQMAMLGSIAQKAVQSHYFDKAVIGTAGIDLECGLTGFSQESVDMCSLEISRAKEVILVADSSKFGKVNHIAYATLDQIDVIVTDSNLDEHYRSALEDMGKRLIIVQV